MLRSKQSKFFRQFETRSGRPKAEFLPSAEAEAFGQKPKPSAEGFGRRFPYKKSRILSIWRRIFQSIISHLDFKKVFKFVFFKKKDFFAFEKFLTFFVIIFDQKSEFL